MKAPLNNRAALTDLEAIQPLVLFFTPIVTILTRMLALATFYNA